MPNPSIGDLAKYITSPTLTLDPVLRGEEGVFVTPANINDDMRPTDHDELLENGIYPLVQQYGANRVRAELEKSIERVAVDAVGTFCAVQCYFLEVIREAAGASPIQIDRQWLPKHLAASFLRVHPSYLA